MINHRTDGTVPTAKDDELASFRNFLLHYLMQPLRVPNESREVWAPRAGDMDGIGLAPVPRDPSGFGDLGEAIARSARIASFVKSGA